jgi:hypothetical protein
MSHSVSEAAARAVKNSQKAAVETRTPEQRLADMRKNLAAKLFVTPDDQRFLLASFDKACTELQEAQNIIGDMAKEVAQLKQDITILNEKMEEAAEEKELSRDLIITMASDMDSLAKQVDIDPTPMSQTPEKSDETTNL